MFIFPIYNHNWRNINTAYTYNKTSVKRKYSHHQTKYMGKLVRLRTFQHADTWGPTIMSTRLIC